VGHGQSGVVSILCGDLPDRHGDGGRRATLFNPTDAQSAYRSIEHTPLEQASERWLRIGAPSTYFYAQVLNPSFLTEMKNVRLQVMLGETQDLIEKLKNNELDLVIATQKISLPRLHYVFLQQENFCLVFPKSLALAVSDPDDLTQVETWLSQQRWISYSAQMPIIRRYWQSVFSKRPDFDPQIIIPDLQAIMRCVEQGMGVSIVPNYLLSGIQGSPSVYVPWHPKAEVSNSLYLACQQDRVREPTMSLAMSKLLESVT
jgi:DNA-binding transcriptional LysR family regulator